MHLRVHIKPAPGSRSKLSEKRRGGVSVGVGGLRTEPESMQGGRRYSIVEVLGTGLCRREYQEIGRRGSGLSAVVRIVLAVSWLVSWLLSLLTRR